MEYAIVHDEAFECWYIVRRHGMNPDLWVLDAETEQDNYFISFEDAAAELEARRQ